MKLATASPSAGEQVSGRELARVVQAHGWKLLEFTEAIISSRWKAGEGSSKKQK